jgi:hypothetical protein
MGVRMRHPGSGGTYDAQPSQVPHLQESGWEVEPGQSETGDVLPAELRRFEGQPAVLMRHALAGEAEVPESSVPIHQSNGWYRVEDQADEDQGEGEVPDDLDSLTVADLQDLLRARSLAVSGAKAELLERLRGHVQEEPAEQADQESEE